MIYAILAWNVILTAFAVWAFIKVRAYKNDQLAKMASLALDATIIGKKIKAYADAQAAMRRFCWLTPISLMLSRTSPTRT